MNEQPPEGMEVLYKYEKALEDAVADWPAEAKLIFRGQKQKEKWKLNSSADRRREKQLPPPGLVEYLENSLIKPARTEGYAHAQNRILNDLELLAALQHQGAATCLIDFTANFHIALWFACGDTRGDKQDGGVFIVNRGNTQTFTEVTPERAEKSIRDLLQEPDTTTPQKSIRELLQRPATTILQSTASKQPRIFHWQPPANENRIVVQHSCFIFSNRSIKKSEYKEIIISKEDKEKIMEILEIYYGLDSQSIFRDFVGFAKSHGQGAPITKNKNVQQLIQKGNKHLQQGDYVNAIICYDKAIEVNSQDADVYRNRGDAKFQLGRIEEAIEDFNNAIKYNSKDFFAYWGRGYAKNLLGMYKDAIEDCNEAIKLNQEYSEIYSNRGTFKGAIGMHEEAIKDFDAAILINPHLPGAYGNRGNANNVLGRHEKAIKDYRKAIELDLLNAIYYLGLGYAKNALGRYKEAITEYSKAIEINPEDGNAYLNRGVAKAHAGMPEEAIVDFEKVIQLNPKDADAYVNRGVAKGQMGMPKEAIIDFEKAIELNSKFAKAYIHLGLVYAVLEKTDEMYLNFETALRLATEQNDSFLVGKIQEILNGIKSLPPDKGGLHL